MNITGQTFLITGATGGIGEAIARLAAARGAKLVLSGRQADVLDALGKELDARTIVCDLADRTDLERLVKEAGDIDVLIANAALPADGPLLGFEPGDVDRALEVNLRAPVMLARLLAPAMNERGRGHLVFVSSLAGKVATSGSSLYSATKFGLRGFASGLRQDLHASGVGVSTVFPGFIRDAGMFAQSGVKLPRGVGTRSPQEVATAVIRAIEEDRGEIDVAPINMRLASALAGLAPELIARGARLAGSDAVAKKIAGSEAHKSRR
ncbi:MAG: SDR family NAD(P)-dependent oxidoreductase [Solirubrobacterales bacterium]|nr:SDR family NAD(P)-dependent oxidoreductase [Solirubrobacterales bacterium]